MNILVTGGLGYIGSNAVIALSQAGHTISIVDNLCNTDEERLEPLRKTTGQELPSYFIDVRDSKALAAALTEHNIEAVIHFAALKAVGESTQKPVEYYDNNVCGLISVLSACKQADVKRIIFSSSATVYGDPDYLPIDESHPLKPATNPYGATKQFCERILEDATTADDLSVVILRYFNPVGAQRDGTFGELPKGRPNNLVPYITQAAAGVIEPLTIYGNDYDTPDGTGVRDFIHVIDLAEAHVASLQKTDTPGTTTYNIGTGKGVSVLELIKTFELVNKTKVPYAFGARRNGDIASCYASCEKAEQELGWKARLSINEALQDSWNWQLRITGDNLDKSAPN